LRFIKAKAPKGTDVLDRFIKWNEFSCFKKNIISTIYLKDIEELIDDKLQKRIDKVIHTSQKEILVQKKHVGKK
jgi:DNA topoisomerase-1